MAPNGTRRGSKRVFDRALPDLTLNTKRKKSFVELESLTRKDQMILDLAAMVLHTTADHLVSLVNSSSARNSYTSLDTSSNSTSNDHPLMDDTPPGSSGSGRDVEFFQGNLSNQQPGDFLKALQPSNLTLGERGTVGNQLDRQALDINLAGITGFDTTMNTFQMMHPTSQEIYPTPPESQYSQDQMSVNDQMSNLADPELVTNREPWIGSEWPLVTPISPYNQDQGYYSQGHSYAQLQSGQIPQSGGGGEAYVDQPFGLNNGYDNQISIGGIMENSWEITGSEKELGQNYSHGQFTELEGTKEKIQPKPVEKSVGAKGRRRGPFQHAEQREETGLTRKLGACIRCRLQRIRCYPSPENPTGCCKTCVEASRSQTRTSIWFPCLRYKITDSELLDNAKSPRPAWTTRWKKMEMSDITRWASADIKTITLTQEVGNLTYSLKVREFVPVQGDALARRWVHNGNRYEYQCAPYAVADMKEAGKVLAQFSEDSLRTSIPFYIKGDAFLFRTYHMAFKYSTSAEREDDRELMKSTLRLWGASRMMSRSAYIVGTETLGMERKDYGPGAPKSNKILCPPVFSAQMEIIFVTQILEPTKKEILNKLKALVQENNRRSWLAIYLCIFLLLHSCALLTKKDHDRAGEQGVNTRFYRPLIIDELHNGAKILLAYFHYCNRGNYPLHMDWTSEDQVSLTGLKKEQIDFMRATVKEYAMKAQHFRYILENNVYEDEYYFIAQLYERDWKPKHTIS